jgi:hypothetical protein
MSAAALILSLAQLAADFEPPPSCTALARRYPTWADRLATHTRTIGHYEQRVSRIERALDSLEGMAATLSGRYRIPAHALLASLHEAFTWDLLRPREECPRRKRVFRARERAVSMVVDTICLRRPRRESAP